MKEATDHKGREILTEDGGNVDRGRFCDCGDPVEIEYEVPYSHLRGVACARCRGVVRIR